MYQEGECRRSRSRGKRPSKHLDLTSTSEANEAWLQADREAELIDLENSLKEPGTRAKRKPTHWPLGRQIISDGLTQVLS